MAFLIVSFVAGLLTVLAPCILPLLPVVVGSAASGRSKWTPYIVVASLSGSIILFTFLLKASTALIAIPQSFWAYVSGSILAVFGITLLFPQVWERVPGLSKLSRNSNKLLGTGHLRKGFWGDVMVGAALGPVFSTCSPTYFVILASVLPASFLLGTTYLIAYVVGLSVALLAIGLIGERLSAGLAKYADPKGWFKRVLGLVFLILGIMVAFGIDKKIEAQILNAGFFDVTKVEQKLLRVLDEDADEVSNNKGTPYVDIQNPSGFLNVDEPFKLADFIGDKVILVDFMTYSCINCQRTFPYVEAWYEKYRDDGLIVVGIHTPEFAFEKDIDNVRAALKKYNLSFPVVLDNDYGTWRAYKNQYWPRKYLIDINGFNVYDHIGEGGYEETEAKIQELLRERAKKLGTTVSFDSQKVADNISETKNKARSRETYFGALRNEFLLNGVPGKIGVSKFIRPQQLIAGGLYLDGSWKITDEYAESGVGSSILYRFDADKVFVVAESDTPAAVEVYLDGVLIDSLSGGDVVGGEFSVTASDLYHLVEGASGASRVLELRPKSSGVRFYAFTFG